MEQEEKEIKTYQEKLENYKELKQQDDAQTKKIEELETIKEKLDNELEQNKQELEELKEKI